MSKDTHNNDGSQPAAVPSSSIPGATDTKANTAQSNDSDGTFSRYPNPIQNTIPDCTINLLQLYEEIASGKHKETTLHLRSIADPKEKSKYKGSYFPYVTPSVTANKRIEKEITGNSGYICLDFDHIEDPLAIKEQLIMDRHTAMVWISPGGNGVKWIVKIDPDKDHKAQYEALAVYALEKYSLVADKACKDPVRACFVSWDPDARLNPVFAEGAEGFQKLPVFKMEDYPIKKEKKNDKVKSKIFPAILQNTDTSKYAETAIENVKWIIAQAQDGEKHRALTKAAYLAGGYVAGGILTESDALQVLKTEIRAKPNVNNLDSADRTIEGCLQKGKEKPIYPEDLNIAGTNNEQILTAKDKTVYNTVFTIVLHFFERQCPIRRNEVTGNFEKDGQVLTEADLNSIYIEIRNLNIKIKKADFELLLNSTHIKRFHPLKDFFTRHQGELPTGYIDSLCNSIIVTNMTDGYKKTVITKWLVGMVAGIYDENYNATMIVLIGGINIGKTEVFRRLLPAELKNYYAESKFSDGKDSQALVCENWLVLQDELDGLSRYEAKSFRNFISANYHSYRPPYGKQNIKRKRLASLCGTSNDMQIISDAENNRRIIPLQVTAINHQAYNNVDKVALFVEAHNLFKAGYNWNLTRDEIRELGLATEDHQITTVEGELIAKNFEAVEPGEPMSKSLSATEILVFLETETKQKLSLKIVGTELRRQGFKAVNKRITELGPRKMYAVRRINENGAVGMNAL